MSSFGPFPYFNKALFDAKKGVPLNLYFFWSIVFDVSPKSIR